MAKSAGSLLETFLLASSIAAGLCGCVAPLCGTHLLAEETADVATITGFSIPELDETGQIKWKVLGGSARLSPSGGPVDITQVRMELYKDSKVDMVLTSTQCLYDRDKREAQTEAPVLITGNNIIITGNGFFWSGTNNLLVIRHDAKVIVTDSKSFVRQSPTNSVTNGSAQESGK